MKPVISLFAILAVAVVGCGKSAERVEEGGPPKVEAKKDAPKKVDPMVEPKKVDPMVEPKKVDPMVEPKKVDPMVEPKKVDPMVEPKKVEPKKDAPKVEPKAEPKKDAPKLTSLDGTFKTGCEKGVIKTITIKGDQYEQKTVTFKEKDCTGTSETKTYKSKIKIVASKTEGFTHDVTFDDDETYGASLSATSLKFEGETVIFTRK